MKEKKHFLRKEVKAFLLMPLLIAIAGTLILCIGATPVLSEKIPKEIRIGDTGTGIPKEIRSRIFDPFFTTKEVGKGTGQGLAISYSVIVKKHGGTLAFETEEDTGTTFIILLPIINEEA